MIICLLATLARLASFAAMYSLLVHIPFSGKGGIGEVIFFGIFHTYIVENSISLHGQKSWVTASQLYSSVCSFRDYSGGFQYFRYCV